MVYVFFPVMFVYVTLLFILLLVNMLNFDNNKISSESHLFLNLIGY